MLEINKQVDYAEGDGYSLQDYGAWCPGENLIRIGNSSVSGKCDAFGRFTGISGLAGATIIAAYIESCYSGQEGAFQHKVRAEYAESPTTITSRGDHQSRVRTSAGVDWDGPTGGGWQQSPSLVSVIQELADSYDPTAIQILVDEDGAGAGNSVDWFAYEYGAHDSGMKLHIEYTPPIAAPTITILPTSAVTSTTARLNGELTDIGGEEPTVHIYWGTSEGQTTPGNWDHDENLGELGVGTFYKDISGLTRGTKYYCRCYATNPGGSTWGAAVEFTTLLENPVAATNAATGVGVSAATLRGTVTDDGGGSCQYRFRYKKAGGDYVYTDWTGAKATGEAFSEGVSGLDASSTYYFNAQVKNSEFESDWGTEQTFNTGAVVVAPTGTTDPATLVADILATLNGTVTADGGEACEVRFQYGLAAPAYGTNTDWQTGKLTNNTFSQIIYGLAPNTIYHFRAQIKNSVATVNGADGTFTTELLPTPFLRRVLRDVFGQGSDINLGNPLEVHDPDVGSRIGKMLLSMDFWSDPQEEVVVTGGKTTPGLPSVTVGDLPIDATIVRAIAIFKFRMVENTNAAENSLDKTDVQPIQVQDATPGTWYDAINFVDEQFKIAATTRESGDVLIGSVDIAGAGKVDANDGYNFQWKDAKAHLGNLQFNDVQTGLRIWYSV